MQVMHQEGDDRKLAARNPEASVNCGIFPHGAEKIRTYRGDCSAI